MSTAVVGRAMLAASPESLAAVQASAAAAAGAARARSAAADGFVDLAFDAGALALSALTGRRVSVSRSTPRKTSATKTTSTKATATKASTARPAYPRALAFLDDKKMSVQEKVFRLLLYLQEKSDREVEKKMKEYVSGPKEEGKGGWTSTLLSFARKALPAVDMALSLLDTPEGRKLFQQLSGPVLASAATALGMPQLAPALLAAGPELAGQLAKAYDGLSEGAGAKTPAGEKSSAETADEKKLATELQYMMEKQRAMTGLLSSCMRAMHDTSMSVIQNIR